MTVVRHIPVKNKLASLISLPGGKKLKDALADAQQNLNALRPDCVDHIDELIAEIQLIASAAGDPSIEARERLYDRSNEIAGLAGSFDLKGLGAGAYSLCELIDCGRDGGECPRGEVTVHVESLQLLRHPDRLGVAGEKAVLDGLAKIIRHAQARASRRQVCS